MAQVYNLFFRSNKQVNNDEINKIHQRDYRIASWAFDLDREMVFDKTVQNYEAVQSNHKFFTAKMNRKLTFEICVRIIED